MKKKNTGENIWKQLWGKWSDRVRDKETSLIGPSRCQERDKLASEILRILRSQTDVCVSSPRCAFKRREQAVLFCLWGGGVFSLAKSKVRATGLDVIGEKIGVIEASFLGRCDRAIKRGFFWEAGKRKPLHPLYVPITTASKWRDAHFQHSI